MATNAATDRYYGTGRRKSSTARVFLKLGKGEIKVNGRTLDEYFGGRKCAPKLIMQPLELVDRTDSFDLLITVRGGGPMGQAGAIRHGIARALIQYDEVGLGNVASTDEDGDKDGEGDSSGSGKLTMRKVLRSAGLVTRDARRVERKKVGFRKARKKEQYSKR